MNFGDVCIGLSSGKSYRHNSWVNGEYIKAFYTNNESDIAMIEKSGFTVKTMETIPESIVLFIDEKKNVVSWAHLDDYFVDTSDCWNEA